MKVTPGSTDVTTYVSLVLSSDGSDATALTITDLDLQYVRSGESPVAKVDATALAATNSAHSDNKAIEIDSTDQPGLYRVDWPDAAFAANAREVILTVKHSSCRAAHLRVELETIQTGDSYAVVSSGTHGNAALKTLIDTLDDYVDTEVAAIKAKTDLIPGTQDGLTFAQMQLLFAAALLGKASGLATTTAVYRAANDSKDRITATVDADGNRTAMTLDAT